MYIFILFVYYLKHIGGIFKDLSSYFPKSYGAWDKLTACQAKAVLTSYLALTVEQKSALKAACASFVKPVSNAAITTKNDFVRLLELRGFNGAQVLWSKALNTKDR